MLYDSPMKNIQFPVIAVTIFAVIYNVLPFFETGDWLIMLLFSISPIAVIWMAYRILKYGIASKYTFEEKFYEDVD